MADYQDKEKNLLEDVNAALLTIPTATITRTNELVCTAATVILEMRGYTIKKKSTTHAPWKMTLEARIKTTRTELSQLGEIQKGMELRDKTSYWENSRDCHHLRPLRLLSKGSQRWQVD